MILYKGAAPNSHWHRNDPRHSGGFTSARQHLSTTPSRMVNHIASSSIHSPFISFTHSFAVATEYALDGATAQNPGRVYEVDFSVLSDDDRHNILFDPVQSISRHYSWVHDHDGGTDLIMGIVDPLSAHILAAHPQRPPGSTPKPPNFNLEMEALTKAIRDSEVLSITFSLAGGMMHTYNVH